ncbi:hypothetical protein KJ693_02155 [bacterium]|nr:hypothetical protein [bacterium]MBU1614094.1 hypothetical protein [bacterium]
MSNEEKKSDLREGASIPKMQQVQQKVEFAGRKVDYSGASIPKMQQIQQSQDASQSDSSKQDVPVNQCSGKPISSSDKGKSE